MLYSSWCHVVQAGMHRGNIRRELLFPLGMQAHMHTIHARGIGNSGIKRKLNLVLQPTDCVAGST